MAIAAMRPVIVWIWGMAAPITKAARKMAQITACGTVITNTPNAQYPQTITDKIKISVRWEIRKLGTYSSR